MNRQSREIFRAVKVLDTYYPKFVNPIECIRSREKSLFLSWVIMIYQCRFISCNKCTTLVGYINNREGWAFLEREGIWEISIVSSHFLL